MVEFFDPRLPDRFWSKVLPVKEGCWIWIGCTNELKGKTAHDEIVSLRSQLAEALAAKEEACQLAEAWASDDWRDSTAFSRIGELRAIGRSEGK